MTTAHHFRSLIAAAALIALAVLLPAQASAQSTLDRSQWSFDARSPIELAPPLPPGYSIQLVLDDDSVEGAFGVGDGSTSQQFLWFNAFDVGSVPRFRLEEIWVYFPPGSNLAVGAPIELVVFHDPDGNPANGATLLWSSNEVIEIVDGNTFSVYAVDSPLEVPQVGSLLVGVVDRFVTTGVTGPTSPAALDTTASQGHSWLAVWTGDPPSPPSLPSDLFLGPIDTLVPGNWTIRAFGSRDIGIPVLDPRLLGLLVVLIAVSGAFILARRC